MKKIRAHGPWLLIQVLRPKEERSLETLKSGIYAEDGEGWQKIGYARGLVHSVGNGEMDKKGRVHHSGVKRGDVVMYRGYIEGAHKPYPLENKDLCFIHQASVECVVTDPGEGGVYEVPVLDP